MTIGIIGKTSINNQGPMGVALKGSEMATKTVTSNRLTGTMTAGDTLVVEATTLRKVVPMSAEGTFKS